MLPGWSNSADFVQVFTMGRWAQRRIRGGGPPAPAPAHMIVAQIDTMTPNDVGVQYSGPVDATSLNAADYTVPADGATGMFISNVTPDVLLLELDNDVHTPHSLQYGGADPQVVSPDSIVLTV